MCVCVCVHFGRERGCVYVCIYIHVCVFQGLCIIIDSFLYSTILCCRSDTALVLHVNLNERPYPFYSTFEICTEVVY